MSASQLAHDEAGSNDHSTHKWKPLASETSSPVRRSRSNVGARASIPVG